MSIAELSKPDLLHILTRNHSNGFTTMGKCPDCDGSGRGGGYCKKCCIAELMRRGASGSSVNRYCQYLNTRNSLNEKLRALHDEIAGAE